MQLALHKVQWWKLISTKLNLRMLFSYICYLITYLFFSTVFLAGFYDVRFMMLATRADINHLSDATSVPVIPACLLYLHFDPENGSSTLL